MVGIFGGGWGCGWGGVGCVWVGVGVGLWGLGVCRVWISVEERELEGGCRDGWYGGGGEG